MTEEKGVWKRREWGVASKADGGPESRGRWMGVALGE